MVIPDLPIERIGSAIKALEQGRFAHEQWADAVNTTVSCRLPPDVRDVSPDAHKNCRFGQWCYGSGAEMLAFHPGFAEIVHEHECMHRYAAEILNAISAGNSVEVNEFERFLGAMKRMRLEIATLEEELKAKLRGLDPLTGAENRVGMLTRLREQQALTRRKGHGCAIAMLDLDHFKLVNDTYGHVVGDNVLATVVRHLIAQLRPYDRVFRYGGEEFLVCMPDTTIEGAVEALERIRLSLATLPHKGTGKEPFHVTASAGVVELDGDIPAERSIERADAALYAAKAGGRNRTVAWKDGMRSSPASAPRA
ncbi:MAG: diguanylate cyclase [Rhodospirillaceae bacterium]|nr:diguanylate cyclase [Rhodospirillaceae bacterium]